jgi:hypothetical protein
MEAALVAIKRELKSNVVPIGELLGRSGMCRHRSILFKYLADSINALEEGNADSEHGTGAFSSGPAPPRFMVRLVRGNYDNDGHCWNVVRLSNSSTGMFSSFACLLFLSLPTNVLAHAAGDLFLVDVMNEPAALLPMSSDAATKFKRIGGRGPGGTSIPVAELREIDMKEVKGRKPAGDRVSYSGFGKLDVGVYRESKVAIKKPKDRSNLYTLKTFRVRDLILLQWLVSKLVFV